MRYLVVLLLLAGCDNSPRYQIAAGNNMVWRLDTRSGDVKSCFWQTTPAIDGEIVCMPEKWRAAVIVPPPSSEPAPKK
jgi:hypothetical protein